MGRDLPPAPSIPVESKRPLGCAGELLRLVQRPERLHQRLQPLDLGGHLREGLSGARLLGRAPPRPGPVDLLGERGPLTARHRLRPLTRERPEHLRAPAERVGRHVGADGVRHPVVREPGRLGVAEVAPRPPVRRAGVVGRRVLPRRIPGCA